MKWTGQGWQHPLLTMLFPPKCLVCDRALALESHNDSFQHTFRKFGSHFGDHWCTDCFRQLTWETLKPRCITCAATLSANAPLSPQCALCFDQKFRFHGATAIGNYCGLLQELIVQLKNVHDEALTWQLGNLLAYQIQQADFFDEIDLVTAIPTHWNTRMKRGFCAAEILTSAIAKSCDLPTSRKVLRCLRKTKKQGTLSTTGRFKNVRNAYGITPKTNIDGLTVLIVDDVMTSGATTSEIARQLMDHGATKVYVGIIARGARVS